eukprot:6087647-Amphidinium_carterae.1
MQDPTSCACSGCVAKIACLAALALIVVTLMALSSWSQLGNIAQETRISTLTGNAKLIGSWNGSGCAWQVFHHHHNPAFLPVSNVFSKVIKVRHLFEEQHNKTLAYLKETWPLQTVPGP